MLCSYAEKQQQSIQKSYIMPIYTWFYKTNTLKPDLVSDLYYML